jgi:hypothetical protein
MPDVSMKGRGMQYRSKTESGGAGTNHKWLVPSNPTKSIRKESIGEGRQLFHQAGLKGRTPLLAPGKWWPEEKPKNRSAGFRMYDREKEG